MGCERIDPEIIKSGFKSKSKEELLEYCTALNINELHRSEYPWPGVRGRKLNFTDDFNENGPIIMDIWKHLFLNI